MSNNYSESDVKHVASMAFYRYYKKFIEEGSDENPRGFFDDVIALVEDELRFASKAIDNGVLEETKAKFELYLMRCRNEKTT